MLDFLFIDDINNDNHYQFEKQMKYSKQRELILQTLRENMIHPTAEQLFKLVKIKDPAVSLATIYRNLKLLTENGIVRKIDGLEETSHFDHNLAPHHHFICKKCKKIYDVYQNIELNETDEILKKQGLAVDEYEISFRGICSECQTKN